MRALFCATTLLDSRATRFFFFSILNTPYCIMQTLFSEWNRFISFARGLSARSSPQRSLLFEWLIYRRNGLFVIFSFWFSMIFSKARNYCYSFFSPEEALILRLAHVSKRRWFEQRALEAPKERFFLLKGPTVNNTKLFSRPLGARFA